MTSNIKTGRNGSDRGGRRKSASESGGRSTAEHNAGRAPHSTAEKVAAFWPLAFLPADATNQTAFYSSSDASVVSVDAQGDLLARAAGSAIITATAGSGCETAQCLVQVVGAAEFCSAVTDSNATYAVSADGSLLRRTHRENSLIFQNIRPR